jgi:uncharacterized protein involved in exopolysaccharide biosynthesis
MTTWPDYLPTPAELVASLRRHKWTGIVVATLLLLGIAAGVFSLPRQYVSEARLFVRIGHQSLTLDPTVTTNQTVSLYETRESELNSIVEVLQSREVLLHVVRTVGAAAILHGQLPASGAEVEHTSAAAASNRSASTTESTSPVAPLASQEVARGAERAEPLQARPQEEQAVAKLAKMLHVWSPKRSHVIALSCEASSPELAQLLIETLLTVYREVHADMHRTTDSYPFFVAQEALLQQRWQEAAEKLQTAKDRLGVTSLEEQRVAQQRQLNQLRQELHTVEVDLAASRGRLTAMRTALEELPQMAAAGQLHALSEGVRTSLFQLETRRQELLARYTPEHPLVQLVTEQMAALRERPESLTPEPSQTTLGVHPARQQLETQLPLEQTQAAALEARQAGLRAHYRQLQFDVAACNASEQELNLLQQQADLAAIALRETTQRLEQARLQKELADGRVSNLNLVQPATIAREPVGPKRTLLLGLGLVVSLATGLLVALAPALYRPTFRSVQAAADMLEIPLLAPRSLPRVWRTAVAR